MSKRFHNWQVIEKIARNQRTFYDKYGLARYQVDIIEALGLYYNPSKEFIFPKQATISEMTGIDKSNISKTIRKLESLGLITSQKAANNRKEYKFTNLFFKEIKLSEELVFKSKATSSTYEGMTEEEIRHLNLLKLRRSMSKDEWDAYIAQQRANKEKEWMNNEQSN